MTHEQAEARAYVEQAAMWMACAVAGRAVVHRMPGLYAPCMESLIRQSERCAEQAMREALLRSGDTKTKGEP